MERSVQVSLHEAKSQLSALGKKAWAGERIIIAREGKRRQPGRFKGKIKMSDDFTETPDDIVSSFYGENT
jgi:hypothetical protein